MRRAHARQDRAREVLLGALALSAAVVLGSGPQVLAAGRSRCTLLTSDPQRGGTVSSDTSEPCPPAGAGLVLTAVPARGYAFAFWSGDASGTANPLNLIMPSVPPSASFGSPALEVEAHFSSLESPDDAAALQGPKAGAEVSGSVDYRIRESPTNPLASADFYLDGELEKSDVAPPFEYVFDASLLSGGTHRLDVEVRDRRDRAACLSAEFVVAGTPVVSWVRVRDLDGITRVRVGGSGFGEGSRILVEGMPIAGTRYDGRRRILVATGGPGLDALFPPQMAVCVTVADADGKTSPCFDYSRP